MNNFLRLAYPCPKNNAMEEKKSCLWVLWKTLLRFVDWQKSEISKINQSINKSIQTKKNQSPPVQDTFHHF